MGNTVRKGDVWEVTDEKKFWEGGRAIRNGYQFTVVTPPQDGDSARIIYPVGHPYFSCCDITKYAKFISRGIEIKLHTRVRLSTRGIRQYGDSHLQGAGGEGVVDLIKDTGLPVGVRWDNGEHNSYSYEDLTSIVNRDEAPDGQQLMFGLGAFERG